MIQIKKNGKISKKKLGQYVLENKHMIIIGQLKDDSMHNFFRLTMVKDLELNSSRYTWMNIETYLKLNAMNLNNIKETFLKVSDCINVESMHNVIAFDNLMMFAEWYKDQDKMMTMSYSLDITKKAN